MNGSGRQPVVLIGFMGAGKTTIGRLLAAELGLGFVDTDALIAQRHGPIPALFAERGEPGFRAVEYEAVREALGRGPAVIALGGGALTHPATRALLPGAALRVYLDVAPEALVARLRRSPTVRPLIGPEPTQERVCALLAQREPAYREAEIVVCGPRRTKRAYALEVAARVRAYAVPALGA